jgi:4-hydroxybenzoate polyprenyltransferase
MADIAMGFLFVSGSCEPLGSFFGLLLASSLLYTSGMVLNDVFDLSVDQRERPMRPLPSGQIAWGWARALGFAFLVGGLAVAVAVGYLDARPEVIPWQSGAVAGVLAACVVGYDSILKKTFLGPLAMGACRFFNVLLGMSLAPQDAWGFDATQISVAAGIGIYITGVTLFARTEATESKRGVLAFAILIMIAGFAALAYFPYASETGPRLQLKSTMLWPATVAILGFTIVRRCLAAVVRPSPQFVQSCAARPMPLACSASASRCIF